MSVKNNAETLIIGCKRAMIDAQEMIDYLEKIRSVDDISENELPMLVSELQTKNSNKTQEYLSCASVVGGNVATAVSTTLACGVLTSGVAAHGLTATTLALATTYGSSLAMGVAIPALGWLVLPTVPIAIVLLLLKDSKVKKFIKENKEKLLKLKDKIAEQRDKIYTYIDELQIKLQKMEDEIKEELSNKIKEYQEKAKKLAKEVAIQIDDLVNVKTNERIQKYNEIILNQFRLQQDLEKRLDDLYKDYDRLLDEKAALERKVAVLMQLLNTLGCPESVINQALAKQGDNK